MPFRIPLIALLAVIAGLWELAPAPSPEPFLEKEALTRTFIPMREWEADAPYGGETAAAVHTALQQCSIVQLGEAQHGDGATFERKVDWIRRLHEQYGFDVLLFESGIWAGIPLDSALKKGQTGASDVNRHLWHFWAKAEETKPLWAFLHQTGMQVGGFDVQFTGAREDEIGLLREITARVQFPDSAWATLKHWLHTAYVYKINGYHQNPPEQEMRKLEAEIAALTNALQQDTTPRGAYDRLLLRNFMWNLTYWGLPAEATNPFRDSIMALNILELKQHVFPGRKIIIWAANAHILHGSQTDGIYAYKSMGTFLWEQLGQACFTVLFTCYNGQTRNIYSSSLVNLYDAGMRSLEWNLHEAGLGEGLIDLRRIPDTAHFKLRVLGHGNHDAHWTAMADALHYIPHMTPYDPN